VRLPYTFAAVLGMVDDPAFRERLARDEGHIPDDASDETVEAALARVEKARNWAERTANEYDYRLQTELPDADFDDDVAAALDDPRSSSRPATTARRSKRRYTRRRAHTTLR